MKNYAKPAVSIQDQIETMKGRGLSFGDEQRAANYLSNISYYRLRAYTYPFQDNADPNHPFIKSVSFEEIINLYVFDRKLRLLVFDAIEKIEVALRTQVIYQHSMKHGAFWHREAGLFRDAQKFYDQLQSLDNEVKRSQETFIKHYSKSYMSPEQPPCWMSLEVSSIGLLSKIFQNLQRSNEKMAVVRHFGLSDVRIFENWIFCFASLRNICAHHGRVWNRRLVPITIANNTSRKYVGDRRIFPNKLYAAISAIQYFLDGISPGSQFKDRLKVLLKECPLQQEKEMGFPENWEKDPFWS